MLKNLKVWHYKISAITSKLQHMIKRKLVKVTVVKRSGHQKIFFATLSNHHTEKAPKHSKKELESATFRAWEKWTPNSPYAFYLFKYPGM